MLKAAFLSHHCAAMSSGLPSVIGMIAARKINVMRTRCSRSTPGVSALLDIVRPVATSPGDPPPLHCRKHHSHTLSGVR